MAFDGIVTRQVVKELNTCLLNGKINKVYEPNKNEILLGIYSNGKNYALLINIDSQFYRMHLTTSQKPNPLNAPGFCMLLRKHLIGMRIKEIKTYDLERIVTIELEGFDELNDFITKKLVVELMGKHSNIILLNNQNHIIDAIRHIDTLSSNATRDILPTRAYEFPSSTKKSFLAVSSFEELTPKIETFEDGRIDQFFSNSFIGISQLLIHSIMEKKQIAEDTKDLLDYKTVYEVLKSILFSSDLHCKTYFDKKKEDYVIETQTSSSSLCVNFFLDDFYTNKEESDFFIHYRNSLLKLILLELTKYKKRLLNMDMKLAECDKKEQYRLYGELITANLYQINANQNLDHIVLQNYYENNVPISIPLDQTISPSLNAKKYFKKYNKLKSACEIINFQKRDTKNQIHYIESIVYELENATTIQEISHIDKEISNNFLSKNHSNTFNKKEKRKKSKTKKESESFLPISISLGNYQVFVGKNNEQNDYLTLKYAHAKDLWFHTKDTHGSHVILKTNDEDISQEIINQCAIIAAYYSKARNSSNVPVDYTYIRYVKKPSGAKTGMVIYTNYSTVNVNPSKFAFLCKQ